MKKTIAITSALAAASSLATAEIKINEFLSFEGFVDSSYSHTEYDRNNTSGSDNSFAVDEVEIDWLFNFGKVTAQVDLEYEGGTTGSDQTNVEQAFVNYDLGNGLTITAGRYESVLGLEAKEAPGLYQFSKAYAFGDANNGNGDDDFGVGNANFLPQYAQGVKLTKVSGDNVYSLSVQDESFEEDNGRLGGDNDGSYSIEGGASIALSDELTWFIGGATEDADNGDAYTINSYVVYETGAWTFGAEIAILDEDQNRYGNDFDEGVIRASVADDLADLNADINANDASLDNFAYSNTEAIQAMIMANYAYSDCCSITARISYHDSETDVNGDITATANSGAAPPVVAADVDEAVSSSLDLEYLKYTLAHNYAVTDNLAIITEISYLDGESGDTDYEALTGAVEVLFTF
jgi:hypothetical protein